MRKIKKEQVANINIEHPYLVMMGLYLAAFVGMFGETALNIAIPQLTEAFKVDTSLMQWMVIGHMLVIGIVLPFASLLMKCFKVRKLTIFSVSVFLIGTLISTFANNFPVLLLGRMIQGIGPGLVLPIMFSMVLEVFPPKKIGAAMGVCSLIIMFAPAIGPALGGLIIGALSWRGIFFLFAVILAIALGFIIKFIINPYEITKPHLDILSCITSILGFGSLVVGVGLASVYGWLSIIVIALIVFGILCVALYVKRQLNMKTPVLNVRAFGIKEFRISTILVMLDFGITLSAMYLMPQYMQSGIAVPVAITGIALLPGGTMNAIFSLIAGKLYDKIGVKKLAMTGFLISIIGVSLLLTTSTSTPLWFVIICHIVLLIGVPLAMSPSQTSALSSLPQELSTDGSTILNTMQQVWGAICTAIATSLLGIGKSVEGLSKASAFTNGFHYGLYFVLALAIIGFILSFSLKGTKSSN